MRGVRALGVILLAVIGALFTTAGSYVQPKDTARFDIVIQDSVSPSTTTNVTEDTYISCGTSGTGQVGLNFGKNGLCRIFTCVSGNGCKYILIRMDPRNIIAYANVAKYDTVWMRVGGLTGSDTVACIDTVGLAWENANWVEGNGLNNSNPASPVASDSCGSTGTNRNAQSHCGGADTAWAVIQSSARVVGDTARVGSLVGLRMSVLGAGGYDLSSHKVDGGLTSDRAPFPSAYALFDHTTRPLASPAPLFGVDTISINITALASYALAQNVPINMFMYIRDCRVAGKGFGGTADSTRSHWDIFSSDADSATIHGSAVGSFFDSGTRTQMYALAHPRFEFIGRWKQIQNMGSFQ